MRPPLLVALKPRWWGMILAGEKRYEIRRRWAEDRFPNQEAWVYMSGPAGGVVGRFVAVSVEQTRAEHVKALGGHGMTDFEVDEYARGLAGRPLYAIRVAEPVALAPDRVIRLPEMRRMGFAPPQGFRYVAGVELAVYREAEEGRVSPLPERNAP